MANITENYKAVIDGLSENLTKLGFTKCAEEDLVTRFQSEKGVVAVVLNDNIISLMGGEDLENVTETPTKLAASLFEETADAKDINDGITADNWVNYVDAIADAETAVNDFESTNENEANSLFVT